MWRYSRWDGGPQALQGNLKEDAGKAWGATEKQFQASFECKWRSHEGVSQPSCQFPYWRGQQMEPLWSPTPTRGWQSSTCLTSDGWSPPASSAGLRWAQCNKLIYRKVFSLILKLNTQTAQFWAFGDRLIDQCLQCECEISRFFSAT